MIASRAAPQVALFGALVVAAAAHAGEAAELEGVVADQEGDAVAGADVVLVDTAGLVRRVAITDENGRFGMFAPPGVHQLAIYRGHGSQVTARVLTLAPAERISLTVRGDALVVRRAPAADTEIVSVAPAGIDGLPLTRDRAVGGLIQTLPGGAPSSPSSVGPGLAGTGRGELPVLLGAVDLRDPVTGEAPGELPLALLDGVSADQAWAAATETSTGAAVLRLAPARAERHRAALLGAGGAVLAPARGGDGEAAGEGRVVARAALLYARRARLTLAAAPVVGAIDPDPTGDPLDARRRRTVMPALARAEARLAGWELDALALLSRTADQYPRAGRIAPLGARDTRSRTLGAVSAEARRPFGDGADALEVAVGSVWSDLDLRTRGGEPLDTAADRLTLATRLSLDGDVLGRHLFRASAGADFSHGERIGLETGRLGGRGAVRAEAESARPYAAIHERYAVSVLELDLGARVDGFSGEGRAARSAGPVTKRLPMTALVSPRFGVRVGRPRGDGAAIFARAGRYATPPPLELLLGPAATLGARLQMPHEDAAVGGLEVARPRWRLSLTGVERRTRRVLEDRFARLSGQLIIADPPGRRRYRALWAQARATGSRWGVGAAYVLSSLRGSYAGYVDPGAGALRPGATAAFDGDQVEVNRHGPLPLDRRHGVRLSGQGVLLVGQTRLRAGVHGRLDGGSPLTALGRDPGSGPAQSFVTRRGALGRTPWHASADAVIAATRRLGGTNVTLGVEAFNLTNRRALLARDQVFTDQAVVPRPGAGRADLTDVRGPTGDLVARRPRFLAPLAYAEPLLLRLMLSVEM